GRTPEASSVYAVRLDGSVASEPLTERRAQESEQRATSTPKRRHAAKPRRRPCKLLWPTRFRLANEPAEGPLSTLPLARPSLELRRYAQQRELFLHAAPLVGRARHAADRAGLAILPERARAGAPHSE